MFLGEYFIGMHKSRKWLYHFILDWLALCKCMLDCSRNLNCGMLVDMNFNDHNNFLFSDQLFDGYCILNDVKGNSNLRSQMCITNEEYLWQINKKQNKSINSFFIG